MAETRSFNLTGSLSVNDIGKGVESFLRNTKNMRVESAITSSAYMIQAKGEDDNWKKIAGMDKAIQIQLEEAGNKIIVNIGSGKWSDKIGAGTLGWLVFPPLAITAAIGAVQQASLPQEVFQFIERFIECDGRMANIQITPINVENPAIEEKMPLKKCAACGSDILDGHNFCPKCGTPVEQAKVCSNCGKELEAGQVFCPYCGTKAE